jgi:hypothetical protein
MAVCTYCEQEMLNNMSCTPDPIVIDGTQYEPVRWGAEIGWGQAQVRCGDCGTPPRGIHHHGCDVEECPACGRQSISCGCRWASDPLDKDDDDVDDDG